MERFCVFDIETASLAEAETYLPPPNCSAPLHFTVTAGTVGWNDSLLAATGPGFRRNMPAGSA